MTAFGAVTEVGQFSSIWVGLVGKSFLNLKIILV